MESNMHEGEKSGAKYRLKDCQYPCPFACPDVSRPTGNVTLERQEGESGGRRSKASGFSIRVSPLAKYVRERRTRQKPR